MIKVSFKLALWEDHALFLGIKSTAEAEWRVPNSEWDPFYSYLLGTLLSMCGMFTMPNPGPGHFWNLMLTGVTDDEFSE